MTEETMPDWVLIEAARRSGWLSNSPEYLRRCYSSTATSYRVFRALCDMIAKYEKEPVDRKLLCAREAVAEWHDKKGNRNTAKRYRDGDNDEYLTNHVRAIELYEQGFGA